MRRIVCLAVLLLPAGCASLDSIPLSDVPIPEAAPRLASEPAPVPQPPPVRPQSLPHASTIDPSPPVATVAPVTSVAVAAPVEDPAIPATRSNVRSAGEAIFAAVDTLLSPMPVMAFANETQGSALAGDGTVYRSGLVERRDVGSAKAMEPEDGEPVPTDLPAIDLTPASFDDVTLSRIEIPRFNLMTLIWAMIGFAALLGLFISARQIRD